MPKISKNKHFRVIGIDPHYGKPLAYAFVVMFETVHKSYLPKMLLEDYGIMGGNSPVLRIEGLKNKLKKLDTLPTVVYIEDTYLRNNPSVLRKLSLILGAIMNYLERNKIQYRMVLNANWERQLFKNIPATLKMERIVKIEIIKEEFNETRTKKINWDDLSIDMIDAILIARHGALEILKKGLK